MDPFRLCEAMLGIPGVRVLAIEELPVGLCVEIEAAEVEARCPSCGTVAEPEERGTVELGEHSAMGQAIRVVWLRRQWRCSASGCAGRWVEEDDGIAAFLVRSPH